MNREQEEVQILGFFRIIKESCSIISSWRKIFFHITLTLILPLSFIHLAHIQLSQSDIRQISFMLDDDSADTLRLSQHLSLNVLIWDWVYCFSFMMAHLVPFTFAILALLSTSAVIYAVACVYTAKEMITFKEVITLMSAVPKVWKGVMVIFVWNFFVVFAYNSVSVLILTLIAVLSSSASLAFFVSSFAFAYVFGLFYITGVWRKASVIVSVLEEISWCGIQAMYQSKLIVFCYGILLIFEILVVRDGGVINRGIIANGLLAMNLMSTWMMFGLVTDTTIYFICENIDMPLLHDHLEGYLGEYVALQPNIDIQLHQFEEQVV